MPLGTTGDCYDRYLVRVEEIKQSIRILRQCLKQIPDGPTMVDDPRVALPPKRRPYNTIESMIRHFKHIMDGIRVPPGEALRVRRGRQRRARLLRRRRRHRPPVQGVLPLAVVRAPVDGGAADPRPPDRGHRADLRHDQHDRRGVRQVTIVASTVTLTIDGQSVTVPKGTNVLEAARTLGIDISAFCYHPGPADRRAVPPVPGLGREEPEAAAELPADRRRGHGRPHDRRAVDARAQAAARVHAASTIRSTARSATRRASARCRGCTSITTTPTRASTRRRSTRPRSSTSARTIVLDQERCILCSRCIRTCDEVAGQHQLEFANRGDHEVLTTAPGEQLDNPYSLNTVDVCPVGALTVEGLPVHDARVGARGDAERVQRLRDRLQHRDPSQERPRVAARAAPQPGRQRLLDVRRGSVHVSRPARGAARRRDRRRPARRLGPRAREPRRSGSACSSRTRRRSASCCRRCTRNEDNFALATLAKAWGVGHVFIAGKPPVPARADGRLRVADVNPNTARRQGDRRGARPRGDAERSSSTQPAREPARARRPRRRAAGHRRRQAQGARGHLDRRARARPGAAARASRCPSPTGPRSPARSRTRRATCSACTRRSRRPARRSPAWEADRAARARDRRRSSRGRTPREVFKDMTAAVAAVEGADVGA